MLKWSLLDPATDDRMQFRVSPNNMDSPIPVQGITVHAASVDGQFRGFRHDEAHQWNFSGVLHTQQQYQEMRDWVYNRNLSVLTDHLNRSFNVRLTSFNATRAPWRHYPWRHKYTVSAITYQGPL